MSVVKPEYLRRNLLHCKDYVCPQCGSDPAGPEAHQQSHHMIPSFDDSEELVALRALADTLRERAHAFANERDALRAENDRLRTIIPGEVEKLNDELCEENEALRARVAELEKGIAEFLHETAGPVGRIAYRAPVGDILNDIRLVQKGYTVLRAVRDAGNKEEVLK